MNEPDSEQATHSLNARLLRFRSQPSAKDALALAEELIAAKRFGDARGVLVSAQSEDGEDGALLVLEGRAWLMERDLVRAHATLLRAVRVDPKRADAYRWLGQVLLKRGDPERAAKTLRRAVELDPSDTEAAALAARAEYLAETAVDEDSVPPAMPALRPPIEAATASAVPAPVATKEHAAPSPVAEAPPAAPPVAVAEPTRAPAPLPPPQRPAEPAASQAKVTPPTAATRPVSEPKLPAVVPPVVPARPVSEPKLVPPVVPTRPVSEPKLHAVVAPPVPARPVSEPKLAAVVPPVVPTRPVSEPKLAAVVPAASFSTTPPARAPVPAPPAAALPPSPLVPARGRPSPFPKAAQPTTGDTSPGLSPAPPLPAPAPEPADEASELSVQIAADGGEDLGFTDEVDGFENLSDSSSGVLVASTPGELSAPRTSPGAVSAPSVPAVSRPPVPSAPRTSPGAVSAPSVPAASRPSPPNAPRTSPGMLSSPGSVSTPSSSGMLSSPGSVSAPRTSPGALSSPGSVSTPSSSGTLPVPSAALAHFAAETPYEPLTTLSGDVDAPESEAEPAERPEAALPAGVPELAPDVPLGADLGRALDADAALEAVRAGGFFEERSSASVRWSQPSELAPAGTRLRNVLIGVWIAAVLFCAAGYYGFQVWTERRHALAAQWVAKASAFIANGDHAELVDAERLLRMARDQHPASHEVPREMLMLHATRVLEDGQRDLSALRTAMVRGRHDGQCGAELSVCQAIISAVSGNLAARDPDLAAASQSATGKASLLYLVGRLEQHLGRADAARHLEQAVQADAHLATAQLALAELDLDASERAQAQARIDAVLAQHPQHVRARLLRLYVGADDVEPTVALAALDGLATAVGASAPADRVLLALTRARLLRRKGQSEAAAAAVEQAGTAGADEPRLMAWVAREALTVGKLGLAQRAATSALSDAPEVAAYRRLLARVLIERGDGQHALVLLEKMSDDDDEVLVMKAEAALQSGQDAALRSVFAALSAAQSKTPELGVHVGALRVRVEAKLSPTPALVEQAKRLAHAAPGDPEALLALAEAALAVHDAEAASAALQQRFVVAPDDAAAYYLLGRARRMAVDAAGAEAAFRKALALAPGQVDSLLGLAALLLDVGKYADADALYQQLVTRSVTLLQGRLGRIEALLGLGRIADAQVQVDAVPEAERSSQAYRLVSARVALASKKVGQALSLLRPLVDAPAKSATVLVLYADALYAAEEIDAAAGAYDSALALDPELPEALIGRADVYLRAERPPKDALDTLQTAEKAWGSRLRPPDLRARMLGVFGHAYIMRSRHGDMETARTVLREAAQLAGAPAEAFFWLGESLGGKITSEAQAAYQRYLKLEPSGKYADRARRALGPLLQ